jgi:RNA polymerase-binding transcription factor DksA
MKAGNFAVELAESRVEDERAAGVARVRSKLRRDGAPACIDCHHAIEPARRRALPSAKRCITCQIKIENVKRRA